MNWTLPVDRVLHGPTNLAELGFEALPDQSSKFVWLHITDIEGTKPDGNAVANAYRATGTRGCDWKPSPPGSR